MKYTNSEQWYQEYGKEVMDKDEFSEFKKYLNDRSKDGSHPLDEWEDLYADFLKDSKKSARKSIKESRGQTVAELLQNASSKTIVHIYNDSTSDEFVDTNDQLKGEFSRFLYYTVSVWNISNDKIVNIYCY